MCIFNLFLSDFTWSDNLSVHLCCCKWHHCRLLSAVSLSPLLRPRPPVTARLPRRPVAVRVVATGPTRLGCSSGLHSHPVPPCTPRCWTLPPFLPGASPSPSGYANGLSKNTPALPGQGVSASFLPSFRGRWSLHEAV